MSGAAVVGLDTLARSGVPGRQLTMGGCAARSPEDCQGPGLGMAELYAAPSKATPLITAAKAYKHDVLHFVSMHYSTHSEAAACPDVL